MRLRARCLTSGWHGSWLSIAAAIIAGAGFVAPAWASQVVIDDFSGGILGARTVTLLPPPNTSTTPQGTFNQSGGVATMTMTGNGNGQGGVELTYNFSPTDLTDSLTNRQFFLEFPQIQRSPENPGDPALSISIQVTDNNGTTGYYGTSVSSQSPINIVLNFYCSDGGVCFSPQPDWTSIKKVDVTMLFPSTYTNATTTAVLDIIRCTPSGGAPPNPPNPTITPGSNPDCSSPVGFSVAFGSDVTGFTSSDVIISGTAPGSLAAAVSGGPSTYTVNVTGMTGGGTVAIQIPANAVTDTWGQGNVASSVVGTTFGQPPAITSTNASAFVAGSAGSFTAAASGVPAPAISLSGTLPTGLTFTSPTISGTPATGTGGVYSLLFSASNGCGSDSQNFTLTVDEAPAITSANATTFTVGAAGSFTVTANGYPAPTLGVSGSLPAGVTFTPATGALSGTPAAGAGGTYALTFTASNGVGSTASQSFTLTVDEAPAITSANATTFTVGTTGSFTVTARGYPVPTLGVTGSLPAGVTFTPATGALSGTPAAGAGGTYALTFTASNGVGTTASQSFTLTVDEAPAITSANATTFTVGAAGSFTVTASGYPAPTLGVTGSIPAGVTFTPATGVLSGNPSAGTGGTHALTFTASNGVGTTASQSFTLTIDEAPAITSANATTFTVGAASSFTVAASGYPTPTLSVTGGLPTGVTFTVSSGLLSGTPATGSTGTYPLTFTATNGIGSPGSQAFTLTVNKASTTTSISSHTPDPSVVGQPVVVNYAISVVPPATGTPTGSVTVTDGVDSCAGTVAAGTCTLSLTDPGSRTLTATYSGDGDFESSSSTATQTVNQAPTATTITGHTPDPSVIGSPVVVTFAVEAVAPGSGTPTGNVTVGDGVDSCASTVAVGTCTVTLHTSGTRTLTASYAGDTRFLASSGTATQEVMDQSDLELTGASQPAAVAPGSAFVHTFTVTNNGPSPDTAVTLAVELPADVSVSGVNPAGTCSVAGTTVTCVPGDLAVSATFTASIELSKPASGFASSSGSVTGAVPDPNSGNNTATVTTTVGQILASPTPVTLRTNIGTDTSGTLTLTNDSPVDVGFTVLERNWRPILVPEERPVQPATRHLLDGAERRVDARDVEKLVADPSVPLAPSAGTVIGSFPTGLALPWGLGLDFRTGDLWVSDLSLGGGDDRDHRFLSDGTPTGDTIDTSSWVNFAALDMTFDPYSNKLWQTNYDEGCIYELDPVAKMSTGTRICPATSAAPIGLAYDPVSDTFLAGSWDDGVVNRFDRSGNVLDSINVGLNIAGLAYNASTKHLFVLVNDAGPADVYVLDTDDNFRVLSSFAVDGLGDYEQGGLEMDCSGNLWAVDQVTGEVLEFTSGEGGTCNFMNIPWLDVNPSTGMIAANGSQELTLNLTSSGQHPGLHQAQLFVSGVDPFAPVAVPVNFTIAFLDVPQGSFADNFIHAVAGAGITVGCGNGDFCPSDPMTRGVMARWLLLARHGATYAPPPCTGIFSDVPCEYTSNADFIEELYREGVTAGCYYNPETGERRYCPDESVQRQQMAVFLEVAKDITPPECTVQVFADVPCSSPYAKFIDDIYARGITAGCGNGNFCPGEPTLRSQEAVFVTVNWGLPHL